MQYAVFLSEEYREVRPQDTGVCLLFRSPTRSPDAEYRSHEEGQREPVADSRSRMRGHRARVERLVLALLRAADVAERLAPVLHGAHGRAPGGCAGRKAQVNVRARTGSAYVKASKKL